MVAGVEGEGEGGEEGPEERVTIGEEADGEDEIGAPAEDACLVRLEGFERVVIFVVCVEQAMRARTFREEESEVTHDVRFRQSQLWY